MFYNSVMRRPRLAFLLLSIFVLLLFLIPEDLKAQEIQAPQPRFALVMGNGSYTGTSKLANPANDARDMGDALAQLGFSTEVITDAGLEAMETAVLGFRDRLAGSPDSVGLFFYAGHGVQSGGENYLIPVDVQIPSESLLRTRAVSLYFVLDSLREAKNKLNVVILDACRDNPFAWARSSNRGLSIVGTQPPGSIVVYATSAGSTAQDGSGRNGTFTEELLSHITQPGLEISEIFRRTGAGVQNKTAGAQIPAIYSQFFGSFYPGGAQTATITSIDKSPEELPEYFFLPAFYEDAPSYAKDAVAAAEEQTYYGQWLSAWYSLMDADPLENDPYILAQKVNIALNGYIEHDNYRGFVFANLDEGEDLENIRYSGKSGSDYFDFDPHAQFIDMKRQGFPIPPILSLVMGDYYYSLWFNYADFSEGWVQSQEEAFNLSLDCYKAAEDAYILVNTASMLRYADVLLQTGQVDKTIQLLAEILEWEPENLEARKTLANAYTVNLDLDQAFAQYDLLASADPWSPEAYDAYSQAAEAALLYGRLQELENYILSLETHFPDDWIAVLLRHRMAVSQEDWPTATAIAVQGMQRFKSEAMLLDSLLGSWLLSAQGYMEGFSFLENQILWSQSESEQLVLLLFYRAAYRLYGLRSAILADPQTQVLLVEEDLRNIETLNAKFPREDLDLESTIKLIREELSQF